MIDDSIYRAPAGGCLWKQIRKFYMLVSGGQLPSAKGFRIAWMDKYDLDALIYPQMITVALQP